MIAKTNIGGGKKSLVLPSNPKITNLSTYNHEIKVNFIPKYSEVQIKKFNIYKSTTKPNSLKNMEYVGSVDYKSEYTVDKILENNINSEFTKGGVNVKIVNGVVTLNGTSDNSAFFISNNLTFEKDKTYRLSGTIKNVIWYIDVNNIPTGYCDTRAADFGDGVIFNTKEGFSKALALFPIEGYTYEDTVIMPKVEEIHYEYTLTGLINDQTYYIAIEAVSIEGYENASIWEIKNGKPHDMYFVCVGASGYSYYSTDGVSWSPMSVLPLQNFESITYGNDRFVCVCDSGYSYYSTDGVSWSPMSGLNNNLNYFGVTYGNGRFVCVGASGYSYYSTDGVSWSPMRVLPSQNFESITYGNGRFVCVGDSGYSYYSTDGASWSRMSGLNNATFKSVAYGNGRFVCVGTGGYSYYSTDGASWSPMSGLNNATFKSVAYGNGRFVCVGTGGYSYYSTDGVSWSRMSGLNNNLNYFGVTYGNGRFVCVGAGGASHYSTDGVNWSPMSGLNNNTYLSVTSKDWYQGD